MADRRRDDSPLAPHRSLGDQKPAASGSSGSTASSSTPAGRGRSAGGASQGKASPELTTRINEAYASSAPIVEDDHAEPVDSDAPAKAPAKASGDFETRGGVDPDAGAPTGTGADRFAGVMAAATGLVTSRGRSGGDTDSTRPSMRERFARRERTRRPSVRPAPAARRTRKARLRMTHIDPWSVMKVSFLLSIALGIVVVVAVAIVWSVLGAADVWSSIDKSVADVVGDTGTQFRIEDYLGMDRVMGFTLIVAVADVILVTVVATLGAFLYNLAAALLGGLEVVLVEDDH